MKAEKISLGLQGIDDEFIMNAQKKLNKKKWGSSPIGNIVLAACLPLLCAAGVVTGFFVDVVEVFSPFLGGSSVQTEIIQEIGRPVGAFATSNGVTISVDAIIGDESMAMVVYSIYNEDGTPFPLPELEEYRDENGLEYLNFVGFDMYEGKKGQLLFSGTHILEGAIGSVMTSYEIYDSDPEDGKIEYVEYFYSNNLPVGKKVTANFGNLSSSQLILEEGQVISEEKVVLAEGYWEIDYRFDYGNSSKTYEINQSFYHEEKEIHLNRVILSPFSVQVEYEYEKFDQPVLEDMVIEKPYSETEFPEAFEEMNFLDSIPFYLTHQDGSVWFDRRLNQTTTTQGSESFSYASGFATFDEIISLEEIASFTFGEITISVN